MDKKEIQKSCVIFAGVVVIIIFIVFFSISQPRYPLEGQISKERIVAPFDFYYFDEVIFQRLVSLNFRPVYVQDLRIADLVLSNCESLFNRLIDLRPLPYEVAKEMAKKDEQLKNLSDDVLEKLLRCEDEKLRQFKEKIKDLLEFWLVERGVVEAGNKKGRGEVILHKISKSGIEKSTVLLQDVFSTDALTLPPKLEDKNIVLGVAMQFVRPNVYFDKELTWEKKEKIIKDAKLSAQKLVKEGEVVVEANSVVTKDEVPKLKYLSMYVKRGAFLRSVGSSVMVVVMFLLWAIWIYRYQKHIFKTPKLMLLLMSLLLGTVFLAKLFGIKNLEFLIPLGAVAMLATILISDSIAYTLILVLCITMVLSRCDFAPSIILLSGSIVSILLISKAKLRSQIIKSAVGGGIANIVVFCAIFLLTKTKGVFIAQDFTKALLQGGLNWGLINGFACCILTFSLLSIFENSFKITTTFKLLDLQDLNSQILKELSIYAPGTHHHSLIVSALVQETAKQIGANVELACAGAYYHDIGKLKNPMAFAENNIYNKLRSSSLEELRTHIADGIEIAQHYRLPQPIIDIIRQHHGTTLLPYILFCFGDLKESEYKRFLIPLKGMKPTTKEAALVMLADIVERAVGNISDHTKIKELIGKIVHEYLLNGQLSNVNLTLRELEVISSAFASKFIDMSTHYIHL